MWDVRGWKRLTVHNDQPLVQAREEFLAWIDEVPEPWQNIWRQRLQSDDDHPHYSVRLELYLHHYFHSNNYCIDIEPVLPNTLNKPDFKVNLDRCQLLVEAKAVLEERNISQQTQRLRQLADNLENTLSKRIFIQPLSTLPPSLPTRKIRSAIEQHIESQLEEVSEFDFLDVHEDINYSLNIIVLSIPQIKDKPSGVDGMMSEVYRDTHSERIREALEQKAGKYGVIDIPFIIAIYSEQFFPTNIKHEIDALFGDIDWIVPTKAKGGITERRRLNGFYTAKMNDTRRHTMVSAVLFYRFKWLEDTHLHHIHIYHNPFAQQRLNPDLFSGISQMVIGSDGELTWINGEPEWV